MKKIGIIRCMQTEDICPGTTDFSFAAQGKGAFEELGPCEVIGFVSCGGCPGKRAVARARMLVDRGAEAVALASCICKGNPIQLPLPAPRDHARRHPQETGRRRARAGPHALGIRMR